MKKKLLLSLFILLSLILLAGCGDNLVSKSESNDTKKNKDTEKYEGKDDELTLTCSGPFVLTGGLFISRVSTSPNESEKISGYFFDEEEGNVGDGEYTFKFNKDKLISYKSKETLSQKLSNEIKNEDFNDITEICKAERKNGRVVLTCEADENDDVIVALSDDNSTPKELKETLEKYTTLTCK